MPDEPMSTVEIGRLFKVEPATVHSWRQRRIFPEPDRMVSSTPIWFASTVSAWAAANGRNVLGDVQSGELAARARRVEGSIRNLNVALESAAHTGGDRGWTEALSNVISALVPLGELITDLARERDVVTIASIDDTEELQRLAREEIHKLIRARFRSWARLIEGEYDGLAEAVVQAAMDPSITYTYPPHQVDGKATMTLAKDITALTITADGDADTLARIAKEHERTVAQVRAWDVWRRIRPGPI